MSKIKILSFFSGGGFLDIGFEKADFKVVWSNEYDLAFSKLYSSGVSSWRKSIGINEIAKIHNNKSIEDIDSDEIISEAFPEGKPSFFGIIGGPPCQDFSINGKNKGFDGSRGKMTTQYFKKILEILPSFFVMENVPGLTRNKSHKKYLDKLLENLKSEYYVDSNKLNALEFGVPQNRERVFIIGIRKLYFTEKDIGLSWFKWPENYKYKNAAKLYNWPNPNPFKQSVIKNLDLPLELCVESCLVPESKIMEIPNANEFFNIRTSLTKLSNIKEGETNRPSFKRLHRFKYSPTACYGNNEVHLHPYKNRRLSVRETLRIQGVPDTYILPENTPLSKKFKMIGNGVPVPLAFSVAKALYDLIKTRLNVSI